MAYNWGQFQPVEGNSLGGISPTNGITAPPPMNYMVGATPGPTSDWQKQMTSGSGYSAPPPMNAGLYTGPQLPHTGIDWDTRIDYGAITPEIWDAYRKGKIANGDPDPGPTAPTGPTKYAPQPVGGPQQGGPVGGAPSSGGGAMPDGIAPWLAQFYQQHGITPGPRGSGVADWQYWQNEALHGASGDTGYILGRMNDEATKGGSGSLANLGNMMGGVMPPDGYGGLIYGGQYSLPTADELHAMPGYQYAQEMSGKAIERSAAAKGTLLTGGTLQRLQQNAIGLGDQQYMNLANLGLGAFNTNYNVFRNNQNDYVNRNQPFIQIGANAAS